MGFSAGDLIPPFFKDQDLKKALKRCLGITPGNIELYKKALKHRSVAENATDSNERLEYLGDSILGAIVSDYLFERFPYKNEGFLTKMRSRVVNRAHLNELAKRIGVSELISHQSGIDGRNSSLHGDAFEALIGAMYLDKGFSAVKRFIRKRLFRYFIDLEELEQTDDDYKSRLINFCQREKIQIRFAAEELGKGRLKYFKVCIFAGSEEVGSGQGNSKKKAEQEASRLACVFLKVD